MFGRINIGVNPQHITTTFQALFEAMDEAIAAKNAVETIKNEVQALLDQMKEGDFGAQYIYWTENGKQYRAGTRSGYYVLDEAITATGFAGEQGSLLPGGDKKDWVCLGQNKSQ